MKAERRYRAVDPENRLVARGLETEWNTALQHVADAEAELARRQQRRPVPLTDEQRDHPDPHAELLLRWKGGIISELSVPLRRPQPAIRTDEDTIDLLRRLAVHYPDAKIAAILN